MKIRRDVDEGNTFPEEITAVSASTYDEKIPKQQQKLVKNYCKILSVKVRDISLEEVFMYYIGRSSV